MKDYERQQFREAFAKKETAEQRLENTNYEIYMKGVTSDALTVDERADMELMRLEAERAYDEANSEYETLVKNLLGGSPVSEALKGMVV